MYPFTKDYTQKPIGLEWRSNTLFIVATVGVGLFTDLFLYGLIVPILPSILEDKVGVPDSQVQGNVSGLLAAYAAASVVTSPFAGILADRLSSRQAPRFTRPCLHLPRRYATTCAQRNMYLCPTSAV